MRKDYIAQWYEVREEQGISDRIYCFLHDSTEQQTQWFHFRHRDTDGIGMLAHMRKQLGYPASPLPHCRDLSEPGFWQTLRSVRRQRNDPTPKKVHWKSLPTPAAPMVNDPDFVRLDASAVCRLKSLAATRGVSLASLTFACLNQVVFSACLQAGSRAWWFYPVNVRGAVAGPEHSNLSSGFYLAVDGNQSAEQIHAQVKAKLVAREHWWLWKMAHIGRWVGKPGVRLIYRRISRSQFYLGSFSYLGDWSLPRHPHSVMGVCGAGSANYPIATGVTECNGELVLALKFHSSVAITREMQQHCLQQWQQCLQELSHA
ncbi:MAG: hypothetical protein LRY66_09395 [Saccharospirillaceae bacterium]|nr:hypothetical protein [Saccharospirillaceae bacterium]MCD8531557.1 hypothetical protein [Saccharospirillaceae bacterium]